jgi:hypothetical protein
MSRVLVAIPRLHEASRTGLERLQAAGCSPGDEYLLNPEVLR